MRATQSLRSGAVAALVLALAGCRSAPGIATRAAIEADAQGSPGVAAIVTSVLFVPSDREADCGVSALVSVLDRANVHFSSTEIVRQAVFDAERGGEPTSALVRFARSQDVFALVRDHWYIEDLEEWIQAGVPPIVLLSLEPLGVGQFHYVVLTGYDDARRVLLFQDNGARDQRLAYDAFFPRWCEARGWALVVCDPSIAHPPATLSARELGALGWLAERKGDLAAARRHYRSALTKDPAFVEAARNLENVERKLGSP